MVGDLNWCLVTALAKDQGTAGTVTGFADAVFWQWRGAQVGVLDSALAEGQGTAGTITVFQYAEFWQ